MNYFLLLSQLSSKQLPLLQVLRVEWSNLTVLNHRIKVPVHLVWQSYLHRVLSRPLTILLIALFYWDTGNVHVDFCVYKIRVDCLIGQRLHVKSDD